MLEKIVRGHFLQKPHSHPSDKQSKRRSCHWMRGFEHAPDWSRAWVPQHRCNQMLVSVLNSFSPPAPLPVKLIQDDKRCSDQTRDNVQCSDTGVRSWDSDDAECGAELWCDPTWIPSPLHPHPTTVTLIIHHLATWIWDKRTLSTQQSYQTQIQRSILPWRYFW